MNQLSIDDRAKILACLVEGNSIRATSRLTGASKNTIVKLLAEAGSACAAHQDKALRNINSDRIQCDEIGSFCYAKQKNVPKELQGKFGYGNVWTWTAIDADTKLILTWHVGNRDADAAHAFLSDVRSRLAKSRPTDNGWIPGLSPGVRTSL